MLTVNKKHPEGGLTVFDIRHFAKMLQKYRKERGLTQNELADLLPVSAQSVSYWECGKGVPDIAHLCKLASILSVSLDDLLQGGIVRPKGLIGIDGGGTKTDFVLIDEMGRKLASVILSGTNPSICGLDEAIAILRRGIDFLRPSVMNVAGIFLGGAGLDVKEDAAAVLTALQEAYPQYTIGIGSDISNVIACSERPDHCVAAISGTGCMVSSCVGGEMRRVGGFGHLFERCGSGYDMGRDVITAVLRACDGTGNPTRLTALLEREVGVHPEERLQDFYRMSVPQIASFAPLLLTAADEGDAVALDILSRHSDYMANMIRTALRHDGDLRHVVFSGSMFWIGDSFYRLVAQRLDEGLTLERLVYPPAWGACLQCARMCGLPDPKLELFRGEKI